MVTLLNMFFYITVAYITKTAYKMLNAEKIRKTKRSEWDGEKDKNYNRIQTARRRWGCE